MKEKLIRNLLLCAFLIGTCSIGGNASESTDEQAQAKAVMGKVYDSYLKIIPYAYATNYKANDFGNKKEKEELLKNLTDLSQFFKNARHAEFFQRPGFRPSLETINNHLEETIMSVEANNYVFAQKRLNVIGALCVSCHSQLPESVSKNAFGSNIVKEKRDRFESDFSYGNYLYLVRRFDEAKNYFEKAIEASLKTSDKAANQEVVTSLKKILSIDTKIKFNYKLAQAFIEKWGKDSRLTSNDKKMIQRWGENLKKWKGFDTASVKSIPKFIEKHLSPLDLKKDLIFTGEDDITFLISSGVLFNYLVENPDTKMAPEILYWMSLAENRMSSTYFFSLGDLYLKDCIKKYPTSPYAKKCYQVYADSIESGFTGSSGTDIPVEEKRELLKLKNLLK
jgi:tetratricopeptide (TPR) repeat protein